MLVDASETRFSVAYNTTFGFGACFFFVVTVPKPLPSLFRFPTDFFHPCFTDPPGNSHHGLEHEAGPWPGLCPSRVLSAVQSLASSASENEAQGRAQPVTRFLLPRAQNKGPQGEGVGGVEGAPQVLAVVAEFSSMLPEL